MIYDVRNEYSSARNMNDDLMSTCKHTLSSCSLFHTFYLLLHRILNEYDALTKTKVSCVWIITKKAGKEKKISFRMYEKKTFAWRFMRPNEKFNRQKMIKRWKKKLLWIILNWKCAGGPKYILTVIINIGSILLIILNNRSGYKLIHKGSCFMVPCSIIIK